MSLAPEPRAATSAPRSDTLSGVDLAQRFAPGTLIAGRYRILSQLGIGGMGVVYKARDTELDLEVALKVLRPDLGADPEWLERFRRELLLAREVSHKNVVRIHDIGESDGLRFLSMAFVAGRPLCDVLADEGPLPPARAQRILRQLAAALGEAHAAGVVHRDLKPGNILLGPDDTAFVTDFGVARSLSHAALTATGVVVGTLDYLSPEQAAGEQVDSRSDLYALGIVLFEMLTGELPFRSTSHAEALAQRLGSRPRDVAATGARVPPHLRRVLRRCLERSPLRRYQSAQELLADLDAERAGVFDRFPRAARLALSVLALAAVSGGAYRLWPRHFTGPAPTAPAAVTSVAVLPLRDETADASLAWASAGVAEMLSGELAEAERLRVLDPARVRRTLSDLKLGDAAGEPELRRLCELIDVGRLVTGSVRRAGSALRVDLRLVAVEGGRVDSLPLSAETASASGLFEVIEELADRLRRELHAPPRPDRGPPARATTSVKAAAAYRQGRQRLLMGDSLGAAPEFERAIRADPEFAAALLDLSQARQALGQQAAAQDAAERAAALLEASDRRLAWRARARRAQLRGDLATAERSYAELVERYPHDTEALLDLAAAQAAQGANARAVASLRRVTQLDAADPRGWLLLGRHMILEGEARKAIENPLVRALALMTQLGNEQGRGDVLNAMGVAHQRLGEYPAALARYGEAAAVRDRIGDRRGAAVSRKNRGSVHVSMGRLADAETDLRAARLLFEGVGDRKGLAEVWNDTGGLLEARGEYPAARRAYQEALRLRRELGNEQQLAQSYDNVGYIFFLEGERDNALVYWRQALDLRRRLGDKGGIVLSTQNLGFLQAAEGRWPDAMRSFLDALQLGREIDFKNAMAVSHGNIALLHQYEGRYEPALASFGEALELLSRLGDKRGLAEFTIKHAMALLELGRPAEAARKLAQAEPWVRATGNREQASDLELGFGEWRLARGEADAALQRFEQAFSLAVASHSAAATLRARIARAQARGLAGDAAAAELQAAARQADRSGDVLLRLRAAEALAQAELLRGRPAQAARWAAHAIGLAERCGWQAGLYRLHALLGRSRQAEGDAKGAAAAYRESARVAGRLRQGLSDELRRSFDTLPAVREAGERETGRARAAAPAR
ncbi:MAG: protein kinase [Vicinamibacteria bacterium]